jgi:hypothetical protein
VPVDLFWEKGAIAMDGAGVCSRRALEWEILRIQYTVVSRQLAGDRKGIDDRIFGLP